MSVESNLLAEYFERRAAQERRDHVERERLLAVARAYREQAKAERERQSDQDLSGHSKLQARPGDSDSASR
jgi:hypothetical protein